jgi:small-conductance mechanosensitive channel
MKTIFKNTHLRSIIVNLLFLSWLIIVSQDVAIAQNSSVVDQEFSEVKQNIAAVKIDGKVLFNVRGIATFTGQQRAAIISKRIEKIAGNPSIHPDSIILIKGEDRYSIMAGRELVMNVYNVDAEMEGFSTIVLAEYIHQKVVSGIKSYREVRSTPVLLKKSLYALLSAIILVMIMLGLFWILKKINIRLQNRFKEKIDSVDNVSHNLIRSNQLWKAIQIFFKTMKIIVIVVIVTIFLQYILGLFPWTNHVAVYTFELVLNPVMIIGESFVKFLPSLAFLIIIFFITRYLLKLIKLFFVGISQNGIVIKDFDPEWALPTFRILRVFIIAFAVIVAYPYIPGSESSAFKGVTVFLGVLFSLGSSSFIGNIIAGYSMTYRGAFKIGDRIKVDELVGFVVEQKLLVTRLRSVKNEEIIIPNSVLLNSNIINFNTRANDLGVIIHTTVGIGYETPWRQVDAMLKLAADRTKGLMKQPEPFVLKQSLGDFAVNYEINAYCNDISRMHIFYTELHQNILDVFNENNVQIMTPAYEGDPEIPKVVPKDQWNTPLAEQ